MVTKPCQALTCHARVSLFLCALTVLSTALHGSSTTMTVEDIARKLKLKDKHLLSTEKKFKVFMESYGKRYSTREEYLRRLGIFTENMVRAVEHQALDPTAVHGVTQFSDLSQEEFERFYTGAKGGFGFRNGFSAAGGEAPPLEVEGLPEEFDWREKGAVTEVKMQVCLRNVILL